MVKKGSGHALEAAWTRIYLDARQDIHPSRPRREDVECPSQENHAAALMINLDDGATGGSRDSSLGGGRVWR
jgi:hypothetical protein